MLGLALMVATFGVLLFGKPPGALRWGLLLGAGTGLLGVWVLGRLMFGARPVLALSPEGVRAFVNRGQVVPWRSITDVNEVKVQNQTQLMLTLAPDAGITAAFGRPCKSFGIPLIFLASKDRHGAIGDALDAFARYGGAEAAPRIVARQQTRADAAAFEARLQAATTHTWALWLVMGSNVAVWLANVASGMSVTKPLPAQLLAWGANSAASVVEDHEYWRLLTATFLHGGLTHLAFNMLGLWEAGRQLNRFYGNAQFLLIYLSSALVGSALSLHFSAQQAVSVGASGAVFGVLGALLVTMYRHRAQVPSQNRRAILTGQLVFLAYAVVQGFARQGVDNAAHVGGLACGCLLALVLADRAGAAGAARTPRRALAGALLSAAAVVALVVTTPVPAVHHRQQFAAQAALQAALPQMKAAEAALRADGQAVQAGTMSETQFVQAIETRHLPAYEAAQRALEPLAVPSGDRLGPALQDIRHGNALMLEMLHLQVDATRHPQSVAVDKARIRQIAAELQAIGARIAALAPARPGASAPR